MCLDHRVDQLRVRVGCRGPLIGHDELQLHPAPLQSDGDIERDLFRCRIPVPIAPADTPNTESFGSNGDAEPLLLHLDTVDDLEQQPTLLRRSCIAEPIAETRGCSQHG